jgi:putative hydrolase of the HAD superfamily
MELQAILFDLDETLILEEASVEEAFLATCQIAEERYGVSPKALTQAVRKHAKQLWSSYPTYEECMALGISSWEGLHTRFEGGSPLLKALRSIAPSYRLEAWTRALAEHGVRDRALAQELAEAFIRERSARYTPFPDAKPLLQELKERYSLALVTNGPPDLQREKLQATGLSAFFELVVISGELGVGKPDPRIFEHTLKELKVPAHEAVMIGNSLERDVAGGKRAGLKAIWVRRSSLEDEYLKGAHSAVTPDATIAELRELPKILAEFCDKA